MRLLGMGNGGGGVRDIDVNTGNDIRSVSIVFGV
jgi:hypothetical protein